MAIFTSRLFYP